ncbi:hypothetical protein MTO96_051035 [Rhipicephalus appendiculatus]
MTHAWPVCASQVFLSAVLTLCLPPAHTQIDVATSPEYEDCNQEAFAFLGIISYICPAQQLAIRRESSSTAASVPETAFIYRPQECHSSGQQSNADNMTHAWPVCASEVFLSAVLTLCLPPAHTQIDVATFPEYEDCNQEAFAFLGIISDICPAQQLAIRRESSSTAASVPETAFIYRPQECHSSGQQSNADNMTHAWPVCASEVFLSAVLTLCLPPAHTQIDVATFPEYEDCNQEAFAFLGIISDICPAQQLAIRRESSSTAASVPETAFIYLPQECYSSGQQSNADNMTHAWPVCASRVFLSAVLTLCSASCSYANRRCYISGI